MPKVTKKKVKKRLPKRVTRAKPARATSKRGVKKIVRRTRSKVSKKKSVQTVVTAHTEMLAPAPEISFVASSKAAPRAATQETSATLIPVIEGPRQSHPLVMATPHHPSPHVLRLKHEVAPPPLADILRETADEQRWARLYVFIDEISLFSAVALAAWLLRHLVRTIFRLPIAVFAWRSPASLPKELREPIPRIAALKKLRLDTLFKAAERHKSIPVVAAVQKAVPERATASAKLLDTPLGFRLWSELATFAVTASVLVLPFLGVQLFLNLKAAKADAMTSAMNGLQSFIDGGTHILNADYLGAADRFSSSSEQFSHSQEVINEVPSVLRGMLAALPQGQELQSGEHVLRAAEALSDAGTQLSSLIPNVTSGDADRSMEDRWQTVAQYMPTVAHDLELAGNELSAVDPATLPPNVRDQFQRLMGVAGPTMAGIGHELEAVEQVGPDLLGLGAPRRYLVVFENNNEIRPTGGFMGTFAVIDVQGGKITKMEIPGGGTYDLQGSLLKRVRPPEPLQLVNSRWEFQDANWWWDWPTSAQKIEWFYQNSSGGSVDGVVAVDASVVQSLLTLTGPIDLPSYNKTISADNFVAETTQQVEVDYDHTANRPKQFLADLAPLLMQRLVSVGNTNGVSLLSVLGQDMLDKHVQIYRNDTTIESSLEQLGWGGEVKPLPPNTDTLGIVHTNIAGGKTDGVIDDAVTHAVHLDASGVMTDTVTLVRTHHGVKGTPFTGVRNVDYVRFYVPPGSVLVSADGFTAPPADLFKPIDTTADEDPDLARIDANETTDPATGTVIDQEFGRTVFGNWMMVDPGSSTAIHLTYRLPWRMTAMTTQSTSWIQYLSGAPSVYVYQFFWNQQAGTHDVTLSHEFAADQSLVVEAAPSDAAINPQGWRIDRTVNTDALMRTAFTTP